MSPLSALSPAPGPKLPPERWSLVLSYVDDLTLWVVCRQVSRLLRAEAEYEFMRMRLKHLNIHWEMESITRNGREEWAYAVFMRTKGFILASIDDLHATFHIDGVISTLLPQDNGIMEAVLMAVDELASNDDLVFRTRLPSTMESRQVFQSRSYFLDVPLPKFTNTNRTIGIEWKSFLDAFFSAYYYSLW